MHRLSPLTRRLLMLAATSSLLLNMSLALLGQPTVLDESLGFLRGQQQDDSWRPMELAHADAAREPSQSLYDWIFYERGIKFIYPPSSLLLFDALALLPRPLWRGALNLVTWLLVLGSAAFSWALAERELRASGEAAPGASVDRAVRAALAALFALTFYPLVKAYTLGQGQTIVNALLAAGLWCFASGRRSSAGVLVACACAIKPQYALLGAWALARREWAFVRAAALVGAAVLGLSLLRYGLESHLGYLEVLAHISRLGEAYYANQSPNGLLNRLLDNGVSTGWSASVYPPFHPVVWLGMLASSLLLLAAALWLPVRAGAGGSMTDFCVAMLATTMASPIAWEHHYGVLLPIYAHLLARLWTRRHARRADLLLLSASWVLAANFFPATLRLVAAPLELLQSYLLFAALGAFLLLLGDLQAGSTQRP